MSNLLTVYDIYFLNMIWHTIQNVNSNYTYKVLFRIVLKIHKMCATQKKIAGTLLFTTLMYWNEWIQAWPLKKYLISIAGDLIWCSITILGLTLFNYPIRFKILYSHSYGYKKTKDNQIHHFVVDQTVR